ncbi:hypothetical protein U879_18210 [Defluviimonas sp. 20V17]|nr:hypothetical protein U879_18210 [Defluviimonas sp. 20V17]
MGIGEKAGPFFRSRARWVEQWICMWRQSVAGIRPGSTRVLLCGRLMAATAMTLHRPAPPMMIGGWHFVRFRGGKP